MTADSLPDEMLDAAFEKWVEAQRAALQIMRDAKDVPTTEADVVEGYRWVARIASLAFDWFVEKADPLHPVLFQLQDEYRKLLVDNPDVRYLFSVLDDTCAYRLVGTRGDAAYVGLTFGTPIGKGQVEGRTGTTTQTYLDEFDLGPDGMVDILIAPKAELDKSKSVNKIELMPGTGQLAVRETFFDRGTERESDLRLELVGDVPPPKLDSEEFASKLEFAGTILQFVVATALSMWADTAQHMNSFGGTAGAAHVEEQEDEVRSHSDADMTYHGGRWSLGESEALVVTVHEPSKDFLYWGLTITSPWMESYDYRYTTINLNNKNAKRSSDGNWRLVIAPSDPGVPNWIDTGGRREGYMIVRWVLADGPPHPTCELVPLDSLRPR
ncbi:MAG TPA: DUF1214 domain-containing protein [Acidimicrobiales bacterium]|nr:DUF1214 domain-containing protein [Acidimicrobiales bacterium]